MINCVICAFNGGLVTFSVFLPHPILEVLFIISLSFLLEDSIDWGFVRRVYFLVIVISEKLESI